MTRALKNTTLPAGITRRLLSLEQAAVYCHVSKGRYKKCERLGTLPGPLSLDGKKLIDRDAIDAALDRMSGLGDSGTGDWDRALECE